MGLATALLLAGCGGGGPLDNPPLVDNPVGSSGQKLSFAYFQKCINPILDPPISSSSACASSGCHANATGTGGALRIIPDATEVTLTGSTDQIRAADMYKNFLSTQGQTVLSDVDLSRLLTKPQVKNVLHGGGLIFESAEDPNLKQMKFWISHPQPQGRDEFSTVNDSILFSSTGDCNPNP
jgi:hypothetical protein